MTDTVETVDTDTRPQCRAPGCDERLPDKRFRYCPEHVHLSSHKGSRKTTASPPRAGAEPIDTTSRVKDDTRAPRMSGRSSAGTVSKLLIVSTLIMMRRQVRRRGILDPTGQLAETLSLNTREAVSIAKPVARLIDTNTTASRVLGPVVRNEDVLGAVMALMDWQSRVRATLDQVAVHGTGNTVGAGAPRPRPAQTVADDRAEWETTEEGPDLSAFTAPVEPIRFDEAGRMLTPPI